MNIESQVSMEYSKNRYVGKNTDMEACTLRRHEILKRRSTHIVPWRERSDSSSPSNPKNTSDEWSKDDSSDFEDSDDSLEELEHFKITMKTIEDDLKDLWGKNKKASQNDNDVGRHQTSSKKPNYFLMQPKDYSDIKSHLIQGHDPQAKEMKLDSGLFDYDDGLSDIEADIYTNKKSVLTSVQNSELVNKKVLEADKFISEEESTCESTLLSQHEILSAIDTNRNKSNYNLEIYHEASSVEIPMTGDSKIFDTFIPPPVLPATFVSRLPPIHRLSSPVSPPYAVFVPCPVNSQYYPRMFTTLQQPRLLFPPSFQPYRQVLYLPQNLPSYLLSPCINSGYNHVPNPSSIPFSNQPDPQLENYPPKSSQQEIKSPHLLKERTNPSQLSIERIELPHPVQERNDRPLQEENYPPRPLEGKIGPPRSLLRKIDPTHTLQAKNDLSCPLQGENDPPRSLQGQIGPLRKKVDTSHTLQAKNDLSCPRQGRNVSPQSSTERIVLPNPIQEKIDPPRLLQERNDPPRPLQGQVGPLRKKVDTPHTLQAKNDLSCPRQERNASPHPSTKRIDLPYPIQEKIDPPRPLQGKIDALRPLHGKNDPPRPLQEKIHPLIPLEGKNVPPRPLQGRIDPPRPLQRKTDPPRPLQGRIVPPRPLQKKIEPPLQGKIDHPLQDKMDIPFQEKNNHPCSLQKRTHSIYPLRERIKPPRSLQPKIDPQDAPQGVFNSPKLRPPIISNLESYIKDCSPSTPHLTPASQIMSINHQNYHNQHQEETNTKKR